MKPALFCAAPLLALSAQTAAPLPADSNPPPAYSIAIADADQRMTVPVQIADAGPFPFVIDTGAERTVISRELAATLGPGPGVRVTAMANIERVATVVIPRIRVGRVASIVGGSRIEAPAFAAIDIGGVGMLGIDALQGHAVTIDFDTGTMAVTPSVKNHREAVVPGEVVVHARDMFGQLVVTDAYLGNRRVRVVIDTGSDVTMGNSALRRLIARKTPDFRQISLRAVTGVSLAADYTQIGAVRIGNTVIGNLPVAFADAPPFARFGLGEKPALMLGMDVLRLFRRVTIDFPNRELRLLLPRDVKRTVSGMGRA